MQVALGSSSLSLSCWLLGCDWRKWPCLPLLLALPCPAFPFPLPFPFPCLFRRAVQEATHLPDNVSGMSVPCSTAWSYAPRLSVEEQAGRLMNKEDYDIIIHTGNESLRTRWQFQQDVGSCASRMGSNMCALTYVLACCPWLPWCHNVPKQSWPWEL